MIFFFEKIALIFDIENWLWKYDFGTFWWTIIHHRIVLKKSFEHVDSWAKNSTTELTLICICVCLIYRESNVTIYHGNNFPWNIGSCHLDNWECQQLQNFLQCLHSARNNILQHFSGYCSWNWISPHYNFYGVLFLLKMVLLEK